MNTALHELNRALAHFRRRQDHTPTPHSAREIAQMQVLAEYLHASHDFSRNEQEIDAVPFTRKAA
jgi:hypothetical protein